MVRGDPSKGQPSLFRRFCVEEIRPPVTESEKGVFLFLRAATEILPLFFLLMMENDEPRGVPRGAIWRLDR